MEILNNALYKYARLEMSTSILTSFIQRTSFSEISYSNNVLYSNMVDVLIRRVENTQKYFTHFVDLFV